MTDAVQLYNKYKETFLTERSKQEVQIDSWIEKIKKVDPAVFEGKVELPEDFTYKALFPEAFKDKPDMEIYEQQYEAAMALINSINKIVEEHNDAAMQLLKEYQEFAVSM